MGPRDEELVRAAFEHWNRGEWEAALEHVDPDVEWRTAAPLLDLPQVSHGHDGVRAFWQAWSSSWHNIRIEPEEFIPAGDELLVLVRWRATSEAGIEVDQPVAFRFLIEDERTTRFISYWERAQAFEALGLPARGRRRSGSPLQLGAHRREHLGAEQLDGPHCRPTSMPLQRGAVGQRPLPLHAERP